MAMFPVERDYEVVDWPPVRQVVNIIASEDKYNSRNIFCSRCGAIRLSTLIFTPDDYR
jgi:hypothetical protein